MSIKQISKISFVQLEVWLGGLRDGGRDGVIELGLDSPRPLLKPPLEASRG